MALASSIVKSMNIEGQPLVVPEKYSDDLALNNTFPRIFVNQVLKLGEKPAIREKVLGIWREISWNAYFEHVKYFALGIKAAGFSKKDTLAILGDNCPEWLYADLAAQHLGGISVGIYPTNTWQEVEYILAHSDAKICVVMDQEQLDKVLECEPRLPRLEKIVVVDVKGIRHYRHDKITTFRAVQEAGKAFEQHHPEVYWEELMSVEPDDVSVMVYTSGTTGPPKGAMLNQRCILAAINQWLQATPMYEGDSVVSYLPLCHILERCMSLFLPLRIGGVVNFAESVDTVQKNLKEIAPTLFAAVPRIWEKMYSSHMVKMEESVFWKRLWYKWGYKVGMRYIGKKNRREPIGWGLKIAYEFFRLTLFRIILDHLGLRRVHFCMCGAAPVAPELLMFFHMLGLKVREAYGQTESSGMACIHQGDDFVFGSVGKPVPGVEVKLAEDGEILIRAENIFAGYYKNPEATGSTIVDGWLHTGDVGEFDPYGHLHIVDRKKDIIITSGGKNISPQAIENKLKVSPYIKEAIVIGDRRKYLTALIQVDEENVGHWMQKNAIPYTTFKDMSQNEKVIALIQEEVNKVNVTLAAVETIKKFRLLEKELDQDDEELTATQKVKRKTIEMKYKDLIESMYAE